jgi:glycosyltransferase involved in cell wall biosynthesis
MNRQPSQITSAFVIPCYNEEQRLPVADFVNFLNTQPDCLLLFVNDGSSDQTQTVLESIAAAASPARVQLLQLKQNGGKAEAIRQGMLTLLNNRTAAASMLEFIGFLDADLATPLDEAQRMVQIARRRAEIEIVLGSRLQLKGHAVARTFKRKMLGRLFSLAASITMGMGIRDTQCGAKLFRVRPWLDQVFASPFMDRWLFDIEILTRVHQLLGEDVERAIYEYPLETWNEVGGSRLKATDFAKAPWKLLLMAWQYRWFPSSNPWQPALAGKDSITVEIEPAPVLLSFPTKSAVTQPAIEKRKAA